MTLRRIVRLVGVISALALSTDSIKAQIRYSDSSLLVKVAEHLPPNSTVHRNIETATNGRITSPVKSIRGWCVLRVPPGTTAAAMTRAAGVPGVLRVTRDQFGSFAWTPNDPLFGQQWGLYNFGQPVNGTSGTPDVDIRMKEAWNIRTEVRSDIIIAVVDTGVDYAHTDLNPNMWINPWGEIPNGEDDDGNGIIDDIYGAGWYHGDALRDPEIPPGDPRPFHPHGSNCAAIIAARGNNDIGTCGVAPVCKLMALRVGAFRGVLESEFILLTSARI